MKMIGEEFLAFFSLERGALLTTKRLATQPGLSIRQYIAGEGNTRKTFTNPLRYLAMTTALVTLGFFLFVPRQGLVGDIERGMASQGAERSEKREPEIAAKRQQVVTLLEEIEAESKERLTRANAKLARQSLVESLAGRVGDITLTWMNVLLLASLPLNATLTSICFRKANFNLAENVVINAYVLGMQNIAAVVLIAPGSLGEQISGFSTLAYMFISFCYQFLVWRSVFDLRGWVWGPLGVILVLVSALSYIIMQGIFTFFLLWISINA
ncbi:MAG: hypothetical protein AAFX06_06375 [Planctomycetota bacterium]